MAVRVYLVPIIGTGTRQDPRRAKYFAGVIPNFAMMDYGLEPVGLVAADVTTAQNTSISANADVTTIPANLDAAPSGGALTATKNALESLNIPAGWVNGTQTYRDILRIVAQIFQLAQRIKGLGGDRLFPAGVTLATQFQDLPSAYRQVLIDAATSFGWDISSLSGTNTLRVIFKTLADQWGNTPITLGPVTF